MNNSGFNHSVRETVKSFIQTELTYGLDEVDPEGDLLEQGIIDSMSLLRLVAFLEDTFQLKIQDEDLVPHNFRTLAGIESFVQLSRNTPRGR